MTKKDGMVLLDNTRLDNPYVAMRHETMRKVHMLRSLATLGANTQRMHAFASALQYLDCAAADELHSIAHKVERAFDALEVPNLHY